MGVSKVGHRPRVWLRPALVWAIVAASTTAHAGPPLRRNLSAYVIFGLQSAGLKNITVTGACNTGVGCRRGADNSECGVITHENPFYGDGSQIAGDIARFNRGGGIIYQLFTNQPNGLQNVFINEPPVESPDPLPLLGDVDGDGMPSCRLDGTRCVTDAGDLAAACEFPVPFPACDPAKGVRVAPNSDCQGAADTSAGNGRCDLPPGTYGDVDVLDDSKLTLTGGTYAVCGFQFGRRTETIANGPAVVNVSGNVAIGNGSLFGPAIGTNCGQIKVNVNGPGSIGFGREGAMNGYFCAPERLLRLGHGNSLTGRFYADTVSADSNNNVYCCEDCGCVDEFPASDGPLRRNLEAYFALAMRRASLKNLNLGTACNVGVNCGTEPGGSQCGFLGTASVTMADYSQLVGDRTYFRSPGGRVWRSFRNNNSPLDNVQLVAPAPNPDGFAPPVIAGTCDDTCTPNVGPIKAACGFPDPFPACDESKPVRAKKGGDCLPYDTVPGNQQCDLPPGTYGSFIMRNGGWTNLEPGNYVFCRFRSGRRAKLTADATTILMPAGGAFRAGNGTELGEGCGDLTILADGNTNIGFGRTGLVAAKVCAPEAHIRLGHGNVLIGQFVSDTLNADVNNVGRCCGDCPACP